MLQGADMASCAGRSVQLEDDDLPYRKGSNTSVRSEGTGTEYYTKYGSLPTYDSQDTVRASRPISTASTSSMRVRRLSSLTDDNTRFPKLQDCAHFHYDAVDINSLQVGLSSEDNDLYHHNGEIENHRQFYVKISSNDRTWTARRTVQNFRMLDQKLHRCIFDRKFSHLPDLARLDVETVSHQEVRIILGDYLQRFSSLAGSMLNCGSVLNWFEIDNRGNRLLAVDDSGINTPAIAAAHAIKRYTAQAADEISLEVGDIVSVIDMPPTDDTIWWRGKRGFEVGFFPHECVELIGDKVPASVVSGIPETPSNKALLKKHGKFISFLRLFFNTRPERIQLKQSGIVKERVFGCDLGEHLLNSEHDVPLVLKSCADVIESHGLVDGIYRLSGITSNIQKLRLAFDEDRVPDLTSEVYLQDVHSISSLLKMYFRELPNPLLTYQLYDKFADAVRDEDNKLLRIHDVVQQLPPPHYRTTEYLMRHLARVAAHGRETGMHSKNLAIVWAPNLLRSKELETGGGAAALRGVGIQAVVTEFLILYAELIFSDKMPSYSSPELKKAQRKPRPKSLAISTPTRLLTLEEARERALTSSIVKPDQRYIDVGGGPSTLPSKYHTVIDLPGYKKKGSKDSGGGKVKKSPGGGLKSLFWRSRSGSIRQKGRKPSIHESLNFEPGERKAITEEDVQHWKRRRIRSAKSAESLLSLPITSKLGSPLTESLDPTRLMSILAGKENSSPTKFSRSMSIESPRHLTGSQDYSLSYPSFVLEDPCSREMAVDVNPDEIQLDFTDSPRSNREKSATPEDGVHRKQSFVRNETKRRVIGHRRTPSAPTTPRHERSEHGGCDIAGYQDGADDVFDHHFNDKDKSVSQPVLQGSALSSKPPHGAGRHSHGAGKRDSESERDRFHIDHMRQDSPTRVSRHYEENGSEKRKGSKTPPKDRKKLKDGKENSCVGDGMGFSDRTRHASDSESCGRDSELITELPESPGSRRKLWTGSASAVSDVCSKERTRRYLYSRHHDYAEIDDNDLVDRKTVESQNWGVNKVNSDNNKSVTRLDFGSVSSASPDGSRRYRVESIDNIRDFSVESQFNNKSSDNMLETDFPTRQMDRHKRKSSSLSSSNSIDSDGSAARADAFNYNKQREFLPKEISNLERGLQKMQPGQYPGNSSMSKCMSIPSDIERSLENIRSVTGSRSDLMSSVTISELSVSQDSVFRNEGAGLERRRRSTSLDGLSDESPLSRTLREINAQIDQAFKHEKHKTHSLHDLQNSPTTPKGANLDFASELISYNDELMLTPTGQRSFGSMREPQVGSPDGFNQGKIRSFSFDNDAKDHDGTQANQNKFVDRPAAEIHIVEAPKVIRAPYRPNKVEDKYVVPEQTTVSTPTPTRPSPPASLDIVSSTSSDQHKSAFLPKTNETSANTGKFPAISHGNETQKRSSAHSPYANVEPERDFRSISEEDFQKILMSDPESLKQMEQSMMYSPVRSRNKGSIFDSDRSNTSSVISPVEGVVPRIRSNRSSLASPEASPISFARQHHNRSFGSPEASPQSARQKLNQSFSSSEASPQSLRQKFNQSYSSSEASPQTGARQKHGCSSSEASPQSRQRHSQSHSSSEASPQSRQRHSQSHSSSEASPKSRQKPGHGYGSAEASPQTRQKLNQSYSSAEASPQTRQRIAYGASSPQFESKQFGASPKSNVRKQESPSHERKGLRESPKVGKKKDSSVVSSPLSPEHKQPRWEDLAGLNDSFNELDLAVFNDNWKKCLAPTGDSIRQSNTASNSSEQLTGQAEFPEVGTGTDTVVLERPSFRRKPAAEKAPAVINPVTSVDHSQRTEIETYDNVPEHEVLRMAKDTVTDKRTAVSERPPIQRSNTAPASPSLPQSPTFRSSGNKSSFLEHSSSFESHSSSGIVREVSFESSAKNTSTGRDGNFGLRKSNTSPALTRQTSFDSSYRSVRVTSLGSSLDEPDTPSLQGDTRMAKNVSNNNNQGQGSYVSMVSSERNQSDYSTVGGVVTSSSANQSAFSVSSRQNEQSSVLIRSESSQSTDFSFPPEIGQPTRSTSSNIQSNTSTLPQMLEEMDVNESCLGIASHQNLSNEMKEMMQEQMKDHSKVMSPLDDILPFSGLTSPLSQQTSFFDTNHPLAGFDMESSMELPDVGSIDLPEVNIQYVSEGPTLIASPNILSQIEPALVHQPIDNTEEEFQNAVNDDLERNLASLSEYLPRHVNVCEPAGQQSQQDENDDVCCQRIGDQASYPGDTIENQAAGLEHMVMISPNSVVITQTPDPVMQDSVSSSSSSSQFDSMSMSTSFTYPQCYDSKHYYSPRVNSLNIQGDLAPPPLEMIEVCKSTLVRAKPPSGKKSKSIRWEYSKIYGENENEVDAKKVDKKKVPSAQRNTTSERGEEKLVMDHRPSLMKGSEMKSKIPTRQLADLVDSDHGELSGTEDEVFVDASEVTPTTNFYAAGSKYFKRRDFLSYGNYPAAIEKNMNATNDSAQRFTFDNSTTRCSLDESMMQMVTSRHDNLTTGDNSLLAGYHDDLINMDIGNENAEDIRFSKAHRSSKLLSLCEKFESGSGQSLNSEDDDESKVKQKSITPPEKNIVASIKQMHESLEFDKEKTEVFGKPQKVRKVSLDECKSPTEDTKICPSPTGPLKERSFTFDSPVLSQKSPTSEVKVREIQKPQGKPPKYRSNSKPRTPSESSLSETEGIKGSPKLSKVDISSKSKIESSPKGQRHSLVSSDEGSPKLLPMSSSPKGQRYSMEVSPKLSKGVKEGPPVLSRVGGSPKLRHSAEGSKIPVVKQAATGRNDKSHIENTSPGTARYSNSPKGARNGSNQSSVDSSPKMVTKGEKMEPKTHRTRRGESVEDRYGFNFERESSSKVHFDENVAYRKSDKKEKDAEEKKKRRGSIKELTNVFEEKIETISKQTAASQSPSQLKLRSRVRSVSPSSAANRSPTLPTNVRHSMELPSRETMVHMDGVFKPQDRNIKQPTTVRMGPKPFYGAKQ